MKFHIKFFIFLILLFPLIFKESFVHASYIQADTDGLSTVQADLERIKFGLTEIQERTKNICPDCVKMEAFTAHYTDMTLKFGGKCTEEMFGSENLTYLNKNITNDSGVFLRGTGDFFLDAMYGKIDKPRIFFHNTLRIRYKWGSGTEVSSTGENLQIIDWNFQTKGAMVNKHLLWNREMWIKFAIGNLAKEEDNFVELGTFPYEVGRGISFGAAYKTAGFLGFTPSFSIDQFAPGILVHVSPIADKMFVEGYIAILENQNTSFKNNDAKVRIQEIGADLSRRPGRQSFASILKGFWNVYKETDKLLSLEPYVVFFKALDQKLEYLLDTDSFITTYGLAAEGIYRKFNWGFEASVNQGNIDIKALDRNVIKITKDSEGFLVEKYTKIFDQDPATVDCPTLATVTDANKCIVKDGPQVVELNGKEIFNTGLYNAYDRIRPEQEALLEGYMVVADCSYQFIEDVLNISLGAGYASGDLSNQQNVNSLSDQLSQKFYGFIPLQSVYSGKRLRHLVIFNEGVPRFESKNPNGKFTRQNITPPIADAKIEFTNICFAGTRIEFKIPYWKKYKALIAPNIIGYWCPDTPLTKIGKEASNFMGTELTTEISAQFYKQFKLYGYFGIFFPGNYYKDMCGTCYHGEPVGSDIGFITNIGASFSF